MLRSGIDGGGSRLRLTREQDREAAYLYLTDEIGQSGVAQTVEVPVAGPGLFLDFDADGYLVGIEFLGPTVQIRPSTLAQAELNS